MKNTGRSGIVRSGAYVLTAGAAIYLLAPVLSILTNGNTGISAHSYWTEPFSIAAVVMFTAVLGVRSVLSARGKWLEVFSVGAIAVQGYLASPFVIFLVREDIGAAYWVAMLFGLSGAPVALILGWIHGASTRRAYHKAQVREGSLARTRYGL